MSDTKQKNIEAAVSLEEDFIPPKDKPAHAKRGRKPNTNFLSFVDAREFMRSEMLPSRGKFDDWYQRHQPKAIPRFPYRVYKEWTTWNDFLGTDNKFNERIGQKWRSFEESIVAVHKMNIKTQGAWMEFCKEKKHPQDIPTRPDLVYDKWRGWNHWLGNKIIEAIEAKQQTHHVAVYYIIRQLDVPTNVFTFGVESGGLSVMKERWDREQFDIVKMFWFEQEKAAAVNQILAAYSSPYQDNERQRLSPNIWDIIWHLQMHFETVIIKN